MGFVKVATDIGSANGDVMELPLEGDQTLSLTTLTASFPEACGLKYKSSSGFTRGIRCVNGCFYPPSTDGWGSAVYLCIFKASEGSPSLTPLTTKRANPFQSMYGSKNEWIVKKNKTEAMLSSASAAGPSDTVTKKKNEIKNFTRDFVLLQNCTIPKTPLSDNAFDALGAEGLVFRGIKFTTAMSDVDVVKQINKALEASKLGKSIDFTLINTKLKKMDHFHVAKNVALLDGQFLFERTSLKYFIYIVPKQNLFDEDNSSKSFSDSDSSDRGVFMSVPKKKFTKTSKTAQKKNLNGSGSDDTNLTGEIIQCYRSNAQNTQRTFVKVNRQEKVLPTLISIISDKEFIFTAKPSVSFISECGVGFGPTKALCSKALNEIRVSDFLEGGDYLKTFIRCEPMLEEFEKYGKICAWSIMHSGITPAFFNRVFVEILLRGSEEALKMNLTLADVANSSIRQELQVVMEAEDVASINSAMADSLLFQYIRTYTRVTRANFEEERTIAVKGKLLRFHCTTLP
ncbi:unnamed protein product [Bemisia tabaci]|uniref:TAR DNA-binding protein 43 N-terminal domain-containing protein n=1 Tax=Bemisia tabaci TaxID=7038 RepID=A0A9P0A0H3_BEMTA|nr:unnamed protein product [Bemisia tabaci]